MGLPFIPFAGAVLTILTIIEGCKQADAHPAFAVVGSLSVTLVVLALFYKHPLPRTGSQQRGTRVLRKGDVAESDSEEPEVFERVSKRLYAFIEIEPWADQSSVTLPTAQLGVSRARFRLCPVHPPMEMFVEDFAVLHIDTATGPGVSVHGEDGGGKLEGHVVCSGEPTFFVADVGETTTFTIKCLIPIDKQRVFVLSSGLERKIKIGERALSGWSTDPITCVYA